MTDSETRFQEKQQKALELLAAKGMKPAHYDPPLIRLLGRMGLQVPPPHFQSFPLGALVFGGYFSLIWGLFMWLFVWPGQQVTLASAAPSILSVGVLFGVILAGWYQYSRRKHQLPDWKDL